MKIEKLPTYNKISKNIITYKVICLTCKKMGLVINNNKLCCGNKVSQEELDKVYQSKPFDNSNLDLSVFF